MCGICGYWQRRPIKDNKILLGMIKPLERRGPDEYGVYLSKNIALGNTRLSVIDLSAGKQPIHNETKKIWIVFNGECYNFMELRYHLQAKGHSFYTNSDTEVLLHLYEEYGTDFCNKIDGMFALSLYDELKDRLILAVDPFGKKPLYYYQNNDTFIFASELKSLISHPDFIKELDVNSARNYFFYGFVPSPNTIFRKVRKLEGGTCLILNKNKSAVIEKYWDLNFSEKEYFSYDTIVKKTEEHIRAAVKKRLVADVPLGVFLSGGIDSTLVAYYMKEIMGRVNVNAFSIGFKDKMYDESDYSKAVAKRLGINHKIHYFSQDDCIKSIKEIYNYIDEPISDPSIIATYLLSKFARKNVTVALSGDGGDEMFFGYPKYMANYLLAHFPLNFLVNKHSVKFMQEIALLFPSSVLPLKLHQFLNNLHHKGYIRNQAWISPFSEKEIKSIYMRDIPVSPFEDIIKHHSSFMGKDIADESSYLDIKLTLKDAYLVKVDRASMANSLEVRSPFLDKNLAEFSARIMQKEKFHGNKLKSILKKLVIQKGFGHDFANRKKMGFGLPISKWLRDKIKGDMEYYLSEGVIRKQGLFKDKLIKEMYIQHLKKQKDNSMKLWSLLVFQYWYFNWMKNE